MSLRLRLARPSDLGAIDGIERASFGNPWPLDAYAQEIEREHGVLEVALVPGEGVVGFSCSWLVSEEAHLLRIAIAPRFRRRGVGRDLLSAVIARAEAAGCGRITLEVASANGAAIRMYAAVGFTEIGRRSGYYRMPPDDALVMRLDLPGDRATPSGPKGPTPSPPDRDAAPAPANRWTPGGG